MAKRRMRRYTPEYRAEAVRLVRSTGRSVKSVARELGIPHGTLYPWVRDAEQESGSAPLDQDERAELHRLRRRVAELEEDRLILKKAAAFFAKGSS